MSYEYKQALVLRKDLNMRKGKMIAQACHASQIVYIDFTEHEYVKAWLASSFAKIALSVSSEEELLALLEKAKEAGLPHSLVTDSGFTEFHGVPTNTCIAIGPGPKEMIDGITGDLKLL